MAEPRRDALETAGPPGRRQNPDRRSAILRCDRRTFAAMARQTRHRGGRRFLRNPQCARRAGNSDRHGALRSTRRRAAGKPYDGAVALGCVIRGETYHFEIVAGESSRALIDLAVARRLALGNGILTVENEAQAEERADPARGDKGGDAARAAIALAALKRELGLKFRRRNRAAPNNARRRGSPPCRRSIRWKWRTRASTTFSPNSRRIGSARRSRATNISPPNSPSSATSCRGVLADQRAIDRKLDERFVRRLAAAARRGADAGDPARRPL